MNNKAAADRPKKRKRYGKDVFYQALRDSLNDLVARGQADSLTKTRIIANARYPDGSTVGETTLYGKKPKTKEFVHKKFLLELEERIDKAQREARPSRVKGGKKAETATEKAARLLDEKKVLEEENESILAQFVELEQSCRDVGAGSMESRIRTLERDLYIVSTLLNRKVGGCLEEVARNVENYEIKYAGQSRLATAKDEISSLERRIYDSTVSPMFGTITGTE